MITKQYRFAQTSFIYIFMKYNAVVNGKEIAFHIKQIKYKKSPVWTSLHNAYTNQIMVSHGTDLVCNLAQYAHFDT